jgi:hypothetical protein
MVKRNTRHKNGKNKNMRGGALSQEEVRTLSDRGLSPDDINMLNNANISFNIVMQKINTVMNDFNGNSDDMARIVMMELLNEYSFQDQNSANNSQDTSLDKFNENNINASSEFSTQEASGGKNRRRHSIKKQKVFKKNRRSRKFRQRGGKCFGNGVGANSYDPNYSIYNTNMLKLFPYRTN